MNSRALASVLLIVLAAGSACSSATDGAVGVHERWYQEQPGYADARPLVSGDLVLFGTGERRVVARDRRSGDIRWSTRVTSVSQSPGVRGENIVESQGVAAVPLVLNTIGVDLATGRELWSYEAPRDPYGSDIPGGVSASRLAADEATVYVPAWGGTVSALDARTGTARWVWRVDPALPHRRGAEGVVVSGDTVYASVWHFLDAQGLKAEAWLVAIDRLTGQELWKVVQPQYTGGVLTTGAPVVYQNLVILATVGGRTFAVDRFTREVSWSFVPRNRHATVAGVALHGDAVYIDGGDEHVYALRAATGEVRWKGRYDGTTSTDFLVTSKRVYVSNGGFLSILDRQTGRRLLKLGQPRTDDDYFASPGAFHQGQVFITVSGAAWSFDEP